MQNLWLVSLFSLAVVCSLVVVGAARECAAQVPPGTVELHAEAVAIGAAFTLPPRTAWSAGLDVSAGKHRVVNVTDGESSIDHLIATGYFGVRWAPDARWQATLSPIGAALVVGNDFGAVYPSARLGVSYFWSRMGAGTELRVVRIAGSEGSGDYWVQWVPVRIAVRL